MSESNWKTMSAAGGLIFVVLQLISQGLMQIGGAEPAFTASSAEIVAFFESRNLALAELGGYLSGLSGMAFLWFLGALWNVLKNHEGESPWMSMTAAMSGVMMWATGTSEGGWGLAMFRLDEGLSEELLMILFDEGNLGFANMWLPLASMLFATNIIALHKGALPRWIGWFGIMIGFSLLVARFFWAAGGWVFMPYVMFWVWTIAVSVTLMLRAGLESDQAAS